MMKSTVQGGSLDECCNRSEKTMNDVDAGYLNMEITGAIRSLPPQISSPLEWQEGFDVFTITTLTNRFPVGNTDQHKDNC